MRCPMCGNMDTQVKDSRPSEDNRAIRRRRECTSCSYRFTTFERIQMQQTMVIKRDGARELFDRDKLLKSIITPLQKLAVNRASIDKLVNEVEQTIGEKSSGEVSSQEIGEIVLNLLKEVDFVGYVRYASIYNAFSSLDDFEKILSKLKNPVE